MALFSDRTSLIDTENAFKVGPYIAQIEKAGHKVIKCNLGEPDFNSAENINQVAVENITSGNVHYTDPQGILPFRQSIARKIEETRGIRVDPEQVVVTTGAKPAISYTMLTYADPGDEVIYPSPGFPIYESCVTFVGAVPVPLHLEEVKGFRFGAADLERLIGQDIDSLK